MSGTMEPNAPAEISDSLLDQVTHLADAIIKLSALDAIEPGRFAVSTTTPGRALV
jgi:hypothetical protein